MDIPLFRCGYSPSEVRMRYKKSVCKHSKRCKDCLYTAHCFICCQDEDHCLRAEVKNHGKGEEMKKCEC